MILKLTHKRAERGETTDNEAGRGMRTKKTVKYSEAIAAEREDDEQYETVTEDAGEDDDATPGEFNGAFMSNVRLAKALT
jgi:hypothetical protein